MPGLTVSAAIRATLLAALQDRTDVVLLGEDVGRAGGVAGTTEGLADLHGTDRVIDLPVAEHGTVGLAVGMALAGMRPVISLSSTSRLLAVIEPLAEAAALDGEFTAPLVLRVPSGTAAGERIDRALPILDIAGLHVVAASSASAASALLDAALRASRPVVLLEPRSLYGSRRELAAPADLGRASVLRSGEHITFAAFGEAVHTALDAAEALETEGISAGVIDLVSLAPLDTHTLGEQLRGTGRLVVLHPGEPAVAERVIRAGVHEAFLYLESPPASAEATIESAVAAARASLDY